MLKLEYLNSKKREKKSTIDRIYDEIEQNIIDEKLLPGFKITEQQLCDKYKCSRTPIREVLRRLESTGLIMLEKNKGATVIGFTKNTYADLIEERRNLETQALKLSIARIEKAEKKMLDDTFDFLKFYYAQRDFAKLAIIIKGFHQIVYYSTYNPRIEKQLLFFYNCCNKANMLNTFYESYIDDIYGYYNVIFDCYNDKNIDKAVNTIEQIHRLFDDFSKKFM